jgi:hypothetical protein
LRLCGKVKTAEPQRNNQRIIAVVQVQVHFSEVLFAPLRLKQKTAETQRKIKRIISVVQVQVQFSEVSLRPLRLNKNSGRRNY